MTGRAPSERSFLKGLAQPLRGGRHWLAGRADQAVAKPGGVPPDTALPSELKNLDRIVAWQIETTGWHLAEARRLRDHAALIGGPLDPTAGQAADGTIQNSDSIVKTRGP
jgi:hypothetical protein